jgi:hypothetical protein
MIQLLRLPTKHYFEMQACPCKFHNGRIVKNYTYYCCRHRKKGDLAAVAVQDGNNLDQPDDVALDQPENVSEMQEAIRFAQEVMEQVVRKRVKPAGVTDMLKIFDKYYGKRLNEHCPGLIVPRSWHTVKKLASDGKKPKVTLRHLCPKCDWLFPLNTTVSICPRCKENSRWEPNKRYSKLCHTTIDYATIYNRLFSTL